MHMLWPRRGPASIRGRRRNMNHTHAYTFWHAHQHTHIDTSKGVNGWEPEIDEYYRVDHNTGHYHNWLQIHDHGKKAGLVPHTHQARQLHLEDDEHTKHHHAVADHEKEE